jgi:hypothetical protein
MSDKKSTVTVVVTNDAEPLMARDWLPPGFTVALLMPLPSRDCKREPTAILSPLPLELLPSAAAATPELIAVQRLAAGESFMGRRRNDVTSVDSPEVTVGKIDRAAAGVIQLA